MRRTVGNELERLKISASPVGRDDGRIAVVGMMLYDGTARSADAISHWCGGRFVQVTGRGLVDDSTSEAIRSGTYIIQGRGDDFYPMPELAVAMYYAVNE